VKTRRALDPIRDFRPAGLAVTLLVVHCPRCCRLTAQAVDEVCLRRGTQRVLLRRDRLADWPAFRCQACESEDAHLVEDV